MQFITWDESLNVGVKQFDEEHKQLINFVNKLKSALQIGAKEKAMEEILVGLSKYVEIHFRHEEYYMKLYDYPDIEMHISEHKALTAKVEDYYHRLNEGKLSFSIELMQFLKNWLVNHISNTDMQYKAFFLSKNV